MYVSAIYVKLKMIIPIQRVTIKPFGVTGMLPERVKPIHSKL